MLQLLCHNSINAPIGDAFILLQDTVICGDGVAGVGYQGNVHGAQAALLPWCVDPVMT